jgi:hypothetical protein
MYDNIDELIEINLNLLGKSENHYLWIYEFVDKDGNSLDDEDRFAEYIEQKGLISIDYSSKQRCDLTETGYEIFKNGGWFEFLRIKSLLADKEQLENKRREAIDKVNVEKLLYEHKLSKWKVKTFWPIFGFGLIGFIFGVYNFVDNLNTSKHITSQEQTNQRMESELSKLRTLILDQKSLDSLRNFKTHIDSLKTK